MQFTPEQIRAAEEEVNHRLDQAGRMEYFVNLLLAAQHCSDPSNPRLDAYKIARAALSGKLYPQEGKESETH